jgi:hypothetical protein
VTNSRKSFWRKLMSVLCVALVSTAVPLFGSATAHAAPPASSCGGAGWTEIDGRELWKRGTAPSLGAVILYYGNGYNCTITYKSAAVGVPTYVSAFICRQSDGKCVIHGGDATHAVWTGALHAPGTCVKWGGGVTEAGGWREYWESGWEHCA